MLSFKRRGVTLGAAIVLPLSLALVPEVVLDTKPDCERATAWVDAHKGNLPQSYAEVRAFPIEFQRAIVAGLTSAQKSEIWRARLADALRNRTLTADQRDAVQATLDRINPEFFARLKKTNEDTEVARQIARAFPATTESREIFTSLGPENGTLTSASFEVVAQKRIRSMASVLALPPCNCNLTFGL